MIEIGLIKNGMNAFIFGSCIINLDVEQTSRIKRQDIFFIFLYRKCVFLKHVIYSNKDLIDVFKPTGD